MQDATRALVDPFGRQVTYLRVSVTDRCDFRCAYCMAEHMTFLPKKDLLSLEELDRVCSAFVAKGVRKLRITGGEPLVRKNIMWLFRALSRHLGSGALDELTLTTNGSQLRSTPHELKAAACAASTSRSTRSIRRRFKAITRWGDFAQGDGWHRRGRASRPRDQAQRRGAQGRQRGRVRRAGRASRTAAAST